MDGKKSERAEELMKDPTKGLLKISWPPIVPISAISILLAIST